MFKRIILLTSLVLLIFGASLCSAESWEQVDAKIWVDIDSSQIVTNGIVRAVAREYRPDNTFYSMSVLVDKTNGKYCFEKIELYSIDGKRLGEARVDAKEKSSWIGLRDGDRLIYRIIGKDGLQEQRDTTTEAVSLCFAAEKSFLCKNNVCFSIIWQVKSKEISNCLI